MAGLLDSPESAPGAEPALRVAIIGGGFCGAVFALHLARDCAVPVAITIYEPRPLLGAGVAYSTRDPAHRINVPAAKMSIFPEDPGHFDHWLRQSGALEADPAALWSDGAAYPQRGVFGRYVAQCLARTPRRHPGTNLRHVQARASAVTRCGSGYHVAADGAPSAAADLVILAASHPPPSPPAGIAAALAGDARLIADPWRDGALDGLAARDRVLIIGTGLSMADIVASLDRRGHQGAITAYSRHGLVSRGHTAAPAVFAEFADVAPPASARHLLHLVRGALGRAARQGLPWQAVLDDVRGQGQRLWAGLALAEQRRLLRHLRSHWDVHRYRLAPQVEALLRRKQAEGGLRVLAASLQDVRPHDAAIDIALRRRGQPQAPALRLAVDAVIVTTGPTHGSVAASNPALASLVRQGLLQPDALGLGIAVTAASEPIAHDGRPAPGLRVVGPLARGRFGELMGLPQVADHAAAIASAIAAALSPA